MISVLNAAGGCPQRKLKRLLQAMKVGGGESERDHVMRVVFAMPHQCDAWVLQRSSEICRDHEVKDEVDVGGCNGEMEIVLAA